MTSARQIALLFLALAGAGCGTASAPTDPTAAGATEEAAALAAGALAAEAWSRARAPYPLAVGNRWNYATLNVMFVRPVGNPDSVSVLGPYVGRFSDRLVCRESIAGRDYVVNRRDYGDEGFLNWWRVRQDRDGLYELDDAYGAPACDSVPPSGAATAARPPAAARWAAMASQPVLAAQPAAWRRAFDDLAARQAALDALVRAPLPLAADAVAEGEIQRLRHPLRHGQSWVIRAEPRFAAEVDGFRMLPTPAGLVGAWSIRITSELFSDQDVVHVYYGRVGYAGLRARLVSSATDDAGNVIGQMTSLQTESLVAAHLARPGLAWGGGRAREAGLRQP